MEITRVDKEKGVYLYNLQAIISRFGEHDIQARSVTYVANSLRSKEYISFLGSAVASFGLITYPTKAGGYTHNLPSMSYF